MTPVGLTKLSAYLRASDLIMYRDDTEQYITQLYLHIFSFLSLSRACSKAKTACRVSYNFARELARLG